MFITFGNKILGHAADIFFVFTTVFEMTIIIRLLNRTKKITQQIYIIELMSIAITLLFMGFIRFPINGFYIIRYSQFGYMAVMAVIYIIGYITAIRLIARSKGE